MVKIKKDVAILCQYFYPEHVSSATLPTELAIGLQKKGLAVGVVSGYPQEYINEKKEEKELPNDLDGIDIKRVKYTTFNNKSKFGRIFNFFSLFLAMITKVFYLKNFKKIIVYSNPPILPLIPYVLKKICKIEFIFVAFDVYPDNALKMKGIKENGLIHKLMDFVNKRVYKNASHVVLLGNEMKKYVIENRIAEKESNLTVIPNWFSNEKVLESNIVLNTEFKEIKAQYQFVVLYSGNMGSFQDIDTILNGILNYKNRKDIFFVFSGHGNKVENVKGFLKDNDITNAKVFGFLTGQDYADVLAISDLCLVSLEAGIEGLGVPSKTYGYLAAGKPVLAIMSSETDIARDLKEFNSGENIQQGDIDGFVDSIKRYYENRELTNKQSLNARTLYESKYTKEINVDRYYKLLDL
ncbi:glycosyltransferase family 4 protein [uncultured Planococcus sp.]|uniref:glycosyltransferase family 4 protein n=1 Tax=uncultured Planococcus sp. TaxID=337815 RepID=UPI00261974C8|nr:glycosyltransferase family 4 protein [uncultured Planococcus sp.]